MITTQLQFIYNDPPQPKTPTVTSKGVTDTPAIDRGVTVTTKSNKTGDTNSLTCYICACGFGSASIKRHIENCKEKFKNEQNLLPVGLQAHLPVPPVGILIPSDLSDKQKVLAWNEAAYKVGMDARNHCPYCNRGFSSQNILKHAYACPQKPANAPDLDGKKTTTSAPVMLYCGICGQEFGTTSLKRHLPICYQKFENYQLSFPAQVRRGIPPLNELLAVLDEIWADGKVTKAEISSQSKAAKEVYNNSLARCPNCTRTFESESLVKHLKGCKPRAPATRSFGPPDELLVTASLEDDTIPPMPPEKEPIYIPVSVRVADIKVLAENK